MISRSKLVVFRDRRGLTQQDIANQLGISRSYYCRIEGGLRNPNPQLLKRFADANGLSLDQAYDLFFAASVTNMVQRDAGAKSAG